MEKETRTDRDATVVRRSRTPGWDLPVGVDRALWQYIGDSSVAEDYDRYFSDCNLLRVDLAFLQRHFIAPGNLIDLGCGSGRVPIHFARLGFRTLGVDLSERMLAVAARKRAEFLATTERPTDPPDSPIALAQANLCELEMFRDASFDYATCMFSTLGMIVGVDQRRRALSEIHRILKPKGLFGLHVHNYWFNLAAPQGRRWVLADLSRRVFRVGGAGDKRMRNYRGIPNLSLHLYKAGELRRELQRAGFRVERMEPLAADRSRRLDNSWFMSRLRANGWLVMCRAFRCGEGSGSRDRSS